MNLLQKIKGEREMLSIKDVKKYLDEDDLRYQEINDNWINITFKCNNINNCIVGIGISDESNSMSLFTTLASLENVTVSKISKITEYANIKNSEYVFTKFFIDEEHQFRLQLGIPLETQQLMSKEVFMRCLYTIFNMADEVYPDLMRLLWS